MDASIRLTENAMEVLRRRYLRRAATGEVIETPAEMFRRVAVTVAQPDATYGASEAEVSAIAERFYDRMTALELLPNSPTLMNSGRQMGQLAACFVVPVGDSTEDIFEAVRWAAKIQKTGGGTGFDFSSLRPAGDLVESTGGVASGPVMFMQVFDIGTEAVKQGGTRRGANMGILRVDHPDILDFIAIKLDATKMQNFNLSVAATDVFMSAAETGSDYALVNPRDGSEVKRLSARRVFAAIVNAAWTIGDPGLVFVDRINRSNPTPALGDIAATNPCGEQPLLPFESCTLASINLAKFVDADGVAWDRLRGAIRDGTHFLDNVIDANRYPLDAIADATRKTRKIGLGVMGFADLLIELGVPYDDDRARDVGSEIAEFLERESIAMSKELAETRDVFPAWDGSVWAERGVRLRNATTTTVAPTGTISIIAGCSSGIEPLFAVAYERRVLDGSILLELNSAFVRRAREAGVWSDELETAIAQRGNVRGLDLVPADLQSLFATAHDCSPAVHIGMQAAFQQHVHAAVSKTINLPASATPGDVAEAFKMAYRLECKGVTAYRDQSRAEQVLSFGNPNALDDDRERCPECSSPVQRLRGCAVCRSCGWSACG